MNSNIGVLRHIVNSFILTVSIGRIHAAGSISKKTESNGKVLVQFCKRHICYMTHMCHYGFTQGTALRNAFYIYVYS